MAGNVIPRVKGMRDFYPEDWAYQNWISGGLLSLGRSFGYAEFEGPVVEHLDLYRGKSSEEIVTQQTFSLEDRDGKALVLRPELTPTLARMVAAREGQMPFPVRWQSYGQFFRYERPQRGRSRGFYQWNIDLMGSDTPAADAEILTLACLSVRTLGLTAGQVRIKVNDRLALEDLLVDSLSLSRDDVRPLFGLVDRIDKMPPDKFSRAMSEQGLSSGQQETLLGLLADDDPSFSPWLQEILPIVELNGVSEFVEIDRRIVRGFDYYTRTVFEAWATTSLRRSLFGGGRYDNLTLQVGGKRQVPGVGFAMGELPILELLKEVDRFPALDDGIAEVLVTVFSNETMPASVKFARDLRDQGIRTELHLKPGDRLDRQLRRADRSRIRYAVIIGPDEIEKGTVILKNMTSGSQETFPLESLKDISSRISEGRTEV